MRKYLGIIVAFLIIPSLAAAAETDALDARTSKRLLALASEQCSHGEKSPLCDLIKKINDSKVKALDAAPAKPKIATAPAPAPSKIPPLITEPLHPPGLPPDEGCQANTQGLFVRADPLDNFHYLVDPGSSGPGTDQSTSNAGASAASAVGASVSYTDNRVAGTQTATIDGRLSYAIVSYTPCYWGKSRETFVYGFGFAPFVSSNGTWNQPVKTTSNSAVQMGTDFQVALSTFPLHPFNMMYLYASPYHQTDFEGLADINGVVLALEPVAYDAYMDAAPKNNNPYVNFFWQLRAEAEILNVDNPGLTNLAKGDHAWLGETVRANLGLFPETSAHPWPDYIAGRLALIGTAQNFYDAVTSRTANYYTVQLQYKLGPCKQSTSPTPGNTTLGAANAAACAIQGSSAISFEYDWGTNKDTLVYANQYLVKFSYAY